MQADYKWQNRYRWSDFFIYVGFSVLVYFIIELIMWKNDALTRPRDHEFIVEVIKGLFVGMFIFLIGKHPKLVRNAPETRS